MKSDFREPNVIRVAPTPLYNTFHEVWRFTQYNNITDLAALCQFPDGHSCGLPSAVKQGAAQPDNSRTQEISPLIGKGLTRNFTSFSTRKDRSVGSVA